MTLPVEDIATLVREKAANQRRFIVAIAGPPGSGKSTLAEALREQLHNVGQRAAVVPMDGFHMDNDVLSAKGLLARKGAPETFDLRAFLDIVAALRRADEEVLVPVFDRSRELAIASARIVAPEDQFLILEGNYLLLNEDRWRNLQPFFDLKILLKPASSVLRQRLWDRWKGYDFTDEAAEAKLRDNDLPNGERVLSHSFDADLVLTTD